MARCSFSESRRDDGNWDSMTSTRARSFKASSILEYVPYDIFHITGSTEIPESYQRPCSCDAGSDYYSKLVDATTESIDNLP